MIPLKIILDPIAGGWSPPAWPQLYCTACSRFTEATRDLCGCSCCGLEGTAGPWPGEVQS